MSDALDVMGMSHSRSEAVALFHEMEPDKPLAMTECCSCENQRGEDLGCRITLLWGYGRITFRPENIRARVSIEMGCTLHAVFIAVYGRCRIHCHENPPPVL